MDTGSALSPPSLSVNERKVMKMILEGKALKCIAIELSISPKTVSTYKGRIMLKLNITNNTQLVVQGLLLYGAGGINL